MQQDLSGTDPSRGAVPPGWSELVGGRDDSLVLVCDFDLTSRGEAGFRDFATLAPESLTLWHTVQPPRYPGRSTATSDSYLPWWSDVLDRSSRNIDAVMGFCAGSVFASVVADEIARRRGHRPVTVLFDPGWPNRKSIGRDFRSVIASLTPLSASEKSVVIREAQALLDAADTDLDSVIDRLVELYRRAGLEAFERVGVASDIGNELIDVFHSYTDYLRSALLIPPGPSWSAATVVLSAEADEAPGFGDRSIRTAVSRRDLLRDRIVADRVFDLIAEGDDDDVRREVVRREAGDTGGPVPGASGRHPGGHRSDSGDDPTRLSATR